MNTKQTKENEIFSELDEIHLKKVTGGAGELNDEQIHQIFHTTLQEGSTYANKLAGHEGVNPLARAVGSIGRTAVAYGALEGGEEIANTAVPNHK